MVSNTTHADTMAKATSIETCKWLVGFQKASSCQRYSPQLAFSNQFGRVLAFDHTVRPFESSLHHPKPDRRLQAAKILYQKESPFASLTRLADALDGKRAQLLLILSPYTQIAEATKETLFSMSSWTLYFSRN